MVHEQANVVFTIPFNLQKSVEKQGLAFPVPDDAVRDYLVATSLSDDQNILQTNYLNFLAGVFTQVNNELEKCREELSVKQIRTSEGLAKWWSSHLEGVRTGLYKAAIDGAKEAIQNLPEIQQKHEELLMKRRSKLEGSKDSDRTDYNLNMVIKFPAAESARVALGQLIRKLEGCEGSQRIKLIIYFDGAHTLTEVVPTNDKENTLHDFLCSCLNEFLASPIFCIFLSTGSRLAQFAAPRAFATSARIRGGKAVTHAPITETPFDCCGDLMVKPGKLTTKDISTIPFMAQFGRPLFWALLRGAGLEASQLHTEILALARAKLVASREINNRYDTFSPAARLAVLDSQLSLDFEPRREKVQIEEAALVESHMRFAYSVPDHQEYLRSGYPSEPLLAEAAAQQLRTWRTRDPFIAVEMLTDILETGLLDHGELGELAGRQLLLDAYHRAVELEQRDCPEKTPLNFSAGCRLINFIIMLYTDECANMVLDSTPDNLEGIQFREAFKDALICFTHFGKMADDTGMTSTAAWAAFIRHMAIICRNGQHTVDCILPVLLWDTWLCEHVMTGMLVQFKRQIQGGTIAEHSIDQAKIGFFPKALEECTHGSSPTSYRPYISLIMELGVQVKTPEEAKTATISSFKKKSDSRPRTPPPIEGSPDQHARYNIFAYGCSSTVYRGIDAGHKASYALLLSSRDFLGEHPRKDAQSLEAVRRMKPFWNGGEDCYHWVEHDNILHGPVRPRKEEFLVGESIGAGGEERGKKQFRHSHHLSSQHPPPLHRISGKTPIL